MRQALIVGLLVLCGAAPAPPAPRYGIGPVPPGISLREWVSYRIGSVATIVFDGEEAVQCGQRGLPWLFALETVEERVAIGWATADWRALGLPGPQAARRYVQIVFEQARQDGAHAAGSPRLRATLCVSADLRVDERAYDIIVERSH